MLAAIIVYPLCEAFWTSLLRWNLITNVKRWTGFGNYAAIFRDPEFLKVIKVTFLYSGLSLLFELTLGLALALLVRAGLRRNLPGFPVIRVLILAPLLVAPLIWGFYFRSFYSPQFGLFNAVLNAIGLPSVLWVNKASLAIYSLAFADIWQWTPFMFSILLGRPSRAARGCGRGGTRRRGGKLAHSVSDRIAYAGAGPVGHRSDTHD